MNSKKTQGFFLLLVFVWLGTFFLNDGFASEYNSRNLIRYCSMFGIIGIGVMFVIVTGGIDLSIGSTIGLIGASLVLLIRLNPVESLKPIAEDDKAKVVCFFWVLVSLMVLASLGWLVFSYLRNNFRFKKALFPLIFLSFSVLSLIALSVANSDAPNTTRIPWIFFLLFSISIHIGLLHGVLITQFQLQPFVVTLGGLLCYRGLIRWLTNDTTQGLGSTFDGTLQLVAKGEVCTVSTLMLFVGFGTALYYALSMMTTKNRTTESFHTQVVGISIGAIIGLIGSSRFWGGFERTDFVELFQLSILGIPFQFSTWTTIVSDTAATTPQWLMKMCWVPLIPISLLMLWQLGISMFAKRSADKPLTVWSKSDFFRLPLDLLWMTEKRQTHGVQFILVSILGLAVSIFFLWNSIFYANNDISSEISETSLWWQNMISVFASLAMVMVSVSRLGECVALHGNEPARILFPIAGALAVLAVLGKTDVPTTLIQMPFFAMVGLAIFAIIIFEKTVFGRYLLAIGNNEDAAKYSGIDTPQVKVAAYVICSGIVGIAAMIFMLDFNSVAPTGFGSFYELYAIAAVVLGGCSLRGGEANIIGVVLGASIMRVLANAPDMIDFPKTLEYTILGLVILIGVIVDDRIRRQSAQKALKNNAPSE